MRLPVISAVTAATLLLAPIGVCLGQAPTVELTRDQVIVAATAPLPQQFRADATVLAFAADGHSTSLVRQGSNGMICLGPVPRRSPFHVACYQEGLEPFMARGRELRKNGVLGTQVDSVRFAEAASGALPLPTVAALYSLTGGEFNPDAGTVTGARALHVIYIPYATTQSTGISARPSATSPWLMDPGTPKAHVMFVPSM